MRPYLNDPADRDRPGRRRDLPPDARAGVIRVFPAGLSGPVVASRTIGGPTTGLREPRGIAVSGGKLFVADASTGHFRVFSQLANGDAAPLRAALPRRSASSTISPYRATRSTSPTRSTTAWTCSRSTPAATSRRPGRSRASACPSTASSRSAWRCSDLLGSGRRRSPVKVPGVARTHDADRRGRARPALGSSARRRARSASRPAVRP